MVETGCIDFYHLGVKFNDMQAYFYNKEKVWVCKSLKISFFVKIASKVIVN